MRTAERGVLVGIVVAVALAVRVGFIATGTVQHPLRADAGQYAQYAANLVEHGVFSLATEVPPAPDSFRSPGYPFVLAVCRVLGGVDGWMSWAIALQVALGTSTVLLVYRLARRRLGFAPSLLAAGATALSPHLVASTAYVLTECVTTFVVTLGLWLVLGATRPVRRGAGAACLGLAVLCNETMIVLPLAVALASWRTGWRQAFGLLAVGLLPLLLWSARNASQPLARSGAARVTASISHGSYPGMVFRDPRWFGFPYREDPAQPAFGDSWGELGRVLGERVAAEPARYAAWYLLQKPVWLWSWPLVQGQDVYVYEVANAPYDRQPVLAATHTLMRLLHVPLMVVAAATVLVVLWRRRQTEWPCVALALVAAGATAAYVPVIPDPRYLQPVRPVVFVLAATGLAAVAGWLAPRLRARPAAAAVPPDA